MPRATPQPPKTPSRFVARVRWNGLLGTRSLKQSDRYWTLNGNGLSQRLDALYFMQGLRCEIGFATVRACP